jgi:hypothetical protein
MPPKKTITEPKVSSTSTTKNRRNIFGQDVKITKTNTRADYGGKVVDRKEKVKQVSVSPKRTVLESFAPGDAKGSVGTMRTMGKKKAEELKDKNYGYKIRPTADGDNNVYNQDNREWKPRVLKTKVNEKKTTYGGTKKNILGKEKAVTVTKRSSGTSLGDLAQARQGRIAYIKPKQERKK